MPSVTPRVWPEVGQRKLPLRATGITAEVFTTMMVKQGQRMLALPFAKFC
jgi:hypothetical protein